MELFRVGRKASICFVLWFLFFTKLSAQDKFTDDLTVTANYHHGFMLPEYSNFLYLVDRDIQSVAINISKKTTGRNDFEQIYNYPEYGVSLFYSTLGNDEVHGREIALFPYFQVDIISNKKFSLYNQTGIGLGYVTRRFDLDENFLNIAVGSKMNIHFNLKFGMTYEVIKKIKINMGLSFDHLSNANLSEPNLGLNSVTGYTGISYMIGEPTERSKHELAPHKGGFRSEAIYSFGTKHSTALDNKLYFTSSFTYEWKWNALRTVNLGLGADLFYDTSAKADLEFGGSTDYRTRDNFKSGIHFSQEFIYNRLSLIIQEGVYLLLTDNISNHIMYNRGIFRYRTSEQFFVQISMKSHLNILDYPEFGLGWHFK